MKKRFTLNVFTLSFSIGFLSESLLNLLQREIEFGKNIKQDIVLSLHCWKGASRGCNASCGSRNYREIQKPDVTILAKGAELHEKHLVEEYARYEFDEVVGRYPDNIRQDAVVPTSYGRTMKEDNSLSFRCMANGKSLVRRYISVAWFGIKIITPQPPGVISCNESFGSFCASL